MMETLVDVFGAFGLTDSEKKTETISLPSPLALATPIAFTTTRQQYRQAHVFIYHEGAITESPKLLAEVGRRIRAGWMSFNRYGGELDDRPTASLNLKTRMVKAEVVEAPLYGCATWAPLKGD